MQKGPLRIAIASKPRTVPRVVVDASHLAREQVLQIDGVLTTTTHTHRIQLEYVADFPPVRHKLAKRAIPPVPNGHPIDVLLQGSAVPMQVASATRWDLCAPEIPDGNSEELFRIALAG